MKVEAVAQILDGISFLLITPEILGEARVNHFRSKINEFIREVMKTTDFPTGEKEEVGFLPILKFWLGLVLIWLVLSLISSLRPGPRLGPFNVGALMLFFPAPAFFTVILFLYGVMRVSTRGFYFAAGAILFLATRVLLFWNYLGPE